MREFPLVLRLANNRPNFRIGIRQPNLSPMTTRVIQPASFNGAAGLVEECGYARIGVFEHVDVAVLFAVRSLVVEFKGFYFRKGKAANSQQCTLVYARCTLRVR